MTAILVGWGFWLVCIGLFLAYWYHRLDCEHCRRMADIEAREAADLVRFNERKRAWDEEMAKVRAENDARFAADRSRPGPGSDPKLAAPEGA